MLADALRPISNATPVDTLVPVPNTVLLPNPVPIVCATDTFVNDHGASQVARSNSTPTPARSALFPGAAPTFHVVFVNKYGTLQGELLQPEDGTNMPPLPSTFSRYSDMNDYTGWDLGMPMEMDPYGRGMNERMEMGLYGGGMDEGMGMGTYTLSPMWPVINMPPPSPPTVEKHGRDEGGDGGSREPAKKKPQKENAAALRGCGGTRAAHGGRGRGARDGQGT